MLRRPPRSPLFPYTTLFRSFEQEETERRLAPSFVNVLADRTRPADAGERTVDLASKRPLFDALLEPYFPPQEADARSEEHTSELQSHVNLVCRLLLEKKNTL